MSAARRTRRSELPAAGTSKARLLATLAEISRQIEPLPEPVCQLLEEARLFDPLRRWSSSGALAARELAGVTKPVIDAIGAVRRAADRMARR